MLYAAYGSNLNIEQMDWRCPESKVVGKGIIKDMRLVFNTHADIIPSIGSYVPVAVWDVPEDDWEWLDQYEGYPRYYVKENVDVYMEENEKVNCVVYVMASDMKGFAPPCKDYWDTILEGYADNEIKEFGLLYSALTESWEKYYEIEDEEDLDYAKTEK